MCSCYYGKLVRKGRVKKDIRNQSFYFLIIDLFLSRGLIFGVWSACASVGNIFGAALAAAFIGYGYEYPFLVCCVLLTCCAIICFFAIIPSPEDVGTCRKKKSFFFSSYFLKI
jgi:MFS family permease